MSDLGKLGASLRKQLNDDSESASDVYIVNNNFIDSLHLILKQLELLNIRFEEAFQTEITEGDIQDEN